MPLTCPNCGAENRETAKFCRKCAQQLVPLGKTEPTPEPALRRRKRRPAADAAAPDSTASPSSSLRLHGFLIAMDALLLAALIGVLLAQRNAVAPARAKATVALAPASAPSNAAAPAIPASAAGVAVLPAPAAPESLPAASLATALPPVGPASGMTTPTTAAPARTDAPARPARAAPKSTPKPSPATSSPPAAAAPAALPPRSAPAPFPVAATMLCADARFLAHAVCLQNECSKPALRQHPQCVRMREQQEALRRGSGDN